MEEHKRRNPQLSAFNYNYPLSLPFWLMRGDLIFSSLCSPSFPGIEGWSELGSSSPSSPVPWLLGERQTLEGGDSMKRFVGTKEGQVWIAGHVPELERPPPPSHWHPLPSPHSFPRQGAQCLPAGEKGAKGSPGLEGRRREGVASWGCKISLKGSLFLS